MSDDSFDFDEAIRKLRDNDKPGFDPIVLEQNAKDLFTAYDALVRAGFDQTQAMYLLGVMMGPAHG